jgi:FlaA1/EpsC-like NDP-sugar epimerase
MGTTVSATDPESPAASYPVFAASEDVRQPRGQFETAISVLERLGDLAAVMVAALLACSTYELLQVGRKLHYSTGTVVMSAIAFAVVFVLMLDHDGGYKRANSLLRIHETERILRVSTQAFGLVFLVTFLSSHLFSRWMVALAVIFVPLLLIIEKQILYLLIRYQHSRGYGLQNVLVYGGGYTGRLVFSALVRSPKLGLNPVAIVDDNKDLAGQEIFEYGYRRERSAPVIAGPLTGDLIREHGGRLVVVGIPSLSQQRLQEITAEACSAGADVAFVPQLSFGSETSADYVCWCSRHRCGRFLRRTFVGIQRGRCSSARRGWGARVNRSSYINSVPCAWTRPSMTFTPPWPAIRGSHALVAGCAKPASMNSRN